MSRYPKDTDYREETVRSVTRNDHGWAIELEAGHLSITTPPVEPKAGMVARLYPARAYSSVRGLYLDGRKVYYRTEKQDREHHEIELYGRDCTDWLSRWDKGRSVWSIEMGGLGPSYEQCIQITTAEAVRHLLVARPDPDSWVDEDAWKADREALYSALFEVETVKALHLSGAQAGAAVSLATALYRLGPRGLFKDPDAKGRLIQVSRAFPSVPA